MAEGWTRVKAPAFMLAVFPGARVWQKDLSDGFLEVFRTVERLGDDWVTHISICHKTYANLPGRYPTWEEQKEACYEFAPGKRMVSVMPGTDEVYVNTHATTFHWWEAVGHEKDLPA
jgi:hypothetical protein